MEILNVALIFFFVSQVSSIDIKTKPCLPDEGVPVNRVNVVPCSAEPCKARYKTWTRLTVAWTPPRNASRVSIEAWGELFAGLYTDISILSTTDMCKITKCPIVAGREITISYGLYANPNYPSFGPTNIKIIYSDDKGPMACNIGVSYVVR